MRITPSIFRIASLIVFHISDKIDSAAVCIGEIVIVIIILLGGALKLCILNSHLSPNLVALSFLTLTPFSSKRQHSFIRKSTGLGQGTSLCSNLRSVTYVNERAHISQPCWPLVSSCKMQALH